MEIQELADDMSCVQNYDAKLKGSPSKSVNIDFNWKKTEVKITEIPDTSMNIMASRGWQEVQKSDKALEEFRKIILVSSILMPPLYIGKTNNLRLRCGQHQSIAPDINSFNARFSKYAMENSLHTKDVKNLIFVCIETKEEGLSSMNEEQMKSFEELIEEILKIAAKPVFGRL